MSNVKKSMPRKKRAIRRWMIAVIMLLLIVLLSPKCFTVEQSLRYFEKQYMTGETEIVYQYPLSASFRNGNHAFTLSRNNGVWVCLSHQFDFYHGWRSTDGRVFDFSDDYLRKANCGQSIISFNKTDEGTKSIVFGAVYDDSIVKLVIYGAYLIANPAYYGDLTSEEFYDRYTVNYEIVVDDFTNLNGVREFYAEYSDDRDIYSWYPTRVAVYDENGNEIFNDLVISHYFAT